MKDPAPGTRHQPGRYEIRLKGHLNPRWATRFDGMSLTPRDDGTTVLEGPVADQAALHGLLQTLRDLGLPLLSLTPSPVRPASHTSPAGTPGTAQDSTSQGD